MSEWQELEAFRGDATPDHESLRDALLALPTQEGSSQPAEQLLGALRLAQRALRGERERADQMSAQADSTGIQRQLDKARAEARDLEVKVRDLEEELRDKLDELDEQKEELKETVEELERLQATAKNGASQRAQPASLVRQDSVKVS